MSTDIITEQVKTHMTINDGNGGKTTTKQTTTIKTTMSGLKSDPSSPGSTSPTHNTSNLRTKTVGEERIKKAKDSGEDIAILSMFGTDTNSIECQRFLCCLGDECLLGDPKKTAPGKVSFICCIS